jgi:hypothetical protein
VARHIYTADRQRQLREVLTCDHTLNGDIACGLDGYVIEVQARALEVLSRPIPWPAASDISGMAGVAVREATSRIAGALAKLRASELAIQFNFTPPGKWLRGQVLVWIPVMAEQRIPPAYHSPGHAQGRIHGRRHRRPLQRRCPSRGTVGNCPSIDYRQTGGGQGRGEEAARQTPTQLARHPPAAEVNELGLVGDVRNT